MYIHRWENLLLHVDNILWDSVHKWAFLSLLNSFYAGNLSYSHSRSYTSPWYFFFTVRFIFPNFILLIFLLFLSAVSSTITPYIVHIIYIASVWILYPLQFSLIPWSKKRKPSSSNHVLCCFNSWRLTLFWLRFLNHI